MATAELKVRIDAEIGDFGKKLNTANKDLSDFGNKATNALKKTSIESTSAKNALNGLGDIAQNASNGIDSVTSSLVPMIQTFSKIKSESGSTQGAIKSVTGALVGGGGLTLALSLASAALIVLIKEPEKAAYALNYLSGSIQEVTENQKAFNEELIKNKSSALVEIDSIKNLVSIAKDETLSRNARTEAIKKLNKEYPEQLGSLKLEGIESKKTSEAIDILSQSLLRKAKIEAASKLLGEAFTKQLQVQTKSTIEQASVLSSAVGLGLNVIGIKNTVALTNGLGNQAEAYKKAGEEAKTYQDIISKLTKESSIDGTLFDDKSGTGKAIKTQADILKQLNIDLLKVSNSVDITFGEGNKQKVSAFAKAIDELTTIGGDKTVISKLQKDLLSIDPASIKMAGKTVGVTLSTGISEGFNEAIPVVAMDLSTKLKGGLTDWQTYVNSELLPKVQGNFETFFNDILMRGKLSFDSLGKAILNTFLSIAASDAARGLTNLFKFSGGSAYSNSVGGKTAGLLGGIAKLIGIGGAGAGVGLAAAGSLSGVAASTGGVILGSGVAAGGTATAATAGTVASGGLLLPILGGIAAVAGIASLFKKRKAEPQPAFTTSNAISTSSSSNVDFGSGRVVFEISGVNLVGVLNRAGAKLQRFGP